MWYFVDKPLRYVYIYIYTKSSQKAQNQNSPQKDFSSNVPAGAKDKRFSGDAIRRLKPHTTYG